MQLKRLACISALAAAAASASFGATIVSYGGAFPIVNQTLDPLDQFNPALGTLTSVEFIFTTDVEGTVFITDGPGNPNQIVDLFFGANLTISDPGANVLVNSLPLSSLSNVLIPGDGSLVIFPLSATGIVTMGTLTDPLLLSQFIGPGTISLLLNAEGQASTDPGLAVPFTVTGFGETSGTLEVVYNFDVGTTPIPESATSLLAGGSLIGLVLLRKRLCRA